LFGLFVLKTTILVRLPRFFDVLTTHFNAQAGYSGGFSIRKGFFFNTNPLLRWWHEAKQRKMRNWFRVITLPARVIALVARVIALVARSLAPKGAKSL
jgi:hypothetical protein